MSQKILELITSHIPMHTLIWPQSTFSMRAENADLSQLQYVRAIGVNALAYMMIAHGTCVRNIPRPI